MIQVTTYMLSFCPAEGATGCHMTTIAARAGYAHLVPSYLVIETINARLRSMGKTELDNLDSWMPGRRSGAAIWGAVIDDLPIEEMARIVVEQRWHLPECVRLYVQSETCETDPEPGVALERSGECQLQTWTCADLEKLLMERGVEFVPRGDPFYWR